MDLKTDSQKNYFLLQKEQQRMINLIHVLLNISLLIVGEMNQVNHKGCHLCLERILYACLNCKIQKTEQIKVICLEYLSDWSYTYIDWKKKSVWTKKHWQYRYCNKLAFQLICVSILCSIQCNVDANSLSVCVLLGRMNVLVGNGRSIGWSLWGNMWSQLLQMK